MRKSRILAVVMSVLMMISMLPAMAFAAAVPAGRLEGELKIKGNPAVDTTLKADYKKVKPEGMTDDYVSFLWERKVSDSENEPLVELSREKKYKVTSEDVGYKIVLTITGLEDKGVTGTLTVTSNVVTETAPAEEQVTEEAPAEEQVTEEIPAEETVNEESSAEEQVNEEIPEEEETIQETLVNEEVYDETPVDEDSSEGEEELTPAEEPGTEEDEEYLNEELQPLDETDNQEDYVSYNAQAVTADGTGVLDFGTVESGSESDVEAQYITVKNTGTGDLNFEGLSPEHFMVEDISETLAAGEEVSLWIVPREGLDAGTYDDTITYTSEEGATASFQAKVTIQEASAEEPSDTDDPAIETPAEPTEGEDPASDDNSESEGTETPDEPTNEPTEPAEEEPVTSITVDSEMLIFDNATEGYETPEAKTVTITNTGNTEVTLAQLQQKNEYFELGALTTETLAAGEQASFTVQPKAGLSADTYTDVVSLKNAADDTELASVTVSFIVEKKAEHKLTVTPADMTLDFGIVESGYKKAPKAQTVTISNDGNVTETLTQPASDWFTVGELTMTELKPGEVCTFTVQPAEGLSADSYMEQIPVQNTSGTEIVITASVTVEEKEDTIVKLTAIQKPAEITGLANGTAKKAKSLKLPSYVVIETTAGNKKASVAWDVKGCAYDPSSTSAQTFNVKGIVTLPDGVKNPDGISLVTSVKVNVNGYTSNIASADDNKITGITPNGQYTTKSNISFTAVGAGMDNDSPRKGDVRYLPLNWKVINTNTWTGSPYAASFGMGRSGDYSLTVVFNRQKYDGSNWVNTGEQDTKKVSFSVVQAADSTVTPTPGPNQKSAVQTGDDTPIVPLVIALIVAIACIAGIIIYRKKNK